MKKGPKIILVSLAIMLVVFLIGPKPKDPVFDKTLPKEIQADPSNIKPDNEDFIWFADSIHNKTKYVILYLHGFSASPLEGQPVMQNVAKYFACNLIAPRLYAHGLMEEEPMLHFTAENYWLSVKEAYVKAKQMGDSVIVMGTSTGCTAALMLASNFKEIHSLILYSPNIDLYDSRSFILTLPWGLSLARMVEKGNYHVMEGSNGKEAYWTTRYRIEALVELKNLLNHAMNESTFRQIKQPLLMLYYYKNNNEQDKVVSVPAMLNMYKFVGTPEALKKKVAMPLVGTHAMASDVCSKDVKGVESETIQFLKHLLIRP